MNRIEARNAIRRVMKRASLPTGSLLTGLDMLARAQFLEGLANKQFNSISARAGSSLSAAEDTIKRLLLIVEPTLNPADFAVVGSGKTASRNPNVEGLNFSKFKREYFGPLKVDSSDEMSAWNDFVNNFDGTLDEYIEANPPSSYEGGSLGSRYKTVPTTREPGSFQGARLSAWVDKEGSSGLYKAAWLGANRALSRSSGPRALPRAPLPGVRLDPRTRSPIGPLPPSGRTPKRASVGLALEANDILSANMLRYIDPQAEEAQMDEVTLEEVAQTATPEEANEIIVGQEKAIRDSALQQVAQEGNFFWMAGRKLRGSADRILRGEITIDDIGGIVARYAYNLTRSAVSVLETEAQKLYKAMKSEMLPGAGEDRLDFDLSSLSPTNWNYIIQEVLADPDHHFSQEVFNWMLDDVRFHPTLNDKEKRVMEMYVRSASRGILKGLDTGSGPDKGFLDAYNRQNPTEAPISPGYFKLVKNKYLGTGGAEVSKRLREEAPSWKLEAEDFLFIMNAQQGRGKFARQTRGSDASLRSRVIRLASENPSLRPHLLPLLAGR